MRKELTFEELDNQQVELLPARETLSANFANVWANNSALALNAAAIASTASATAAQVITVTQS
jgi:hypothetical protein